MMENVVTNNDPAVLDECDIHQSQSQDTIDISNLYKDNNFVDPESNEQKEKITLPKRHVILFNVRNAVVAAFSAIIGILLGTYCEFTFALIVFSVLTVTTTLYCFIFKQSKTAIVLISVIGLIFYFYSSSQIERITSNKELECQYKGVVVSVNNYDRSSVVVLEPAEGVVDYKIKLTINSNYDLNIKNGDVICADLLLETPRHKENEHSSDERLQCLMLGVDYCAYTDYDDVEFLGQQSNHIMMPFWNAGDIIVSNLEESLGQDDAALVSGMLLGRDEMLTAEADQAFYKAGITHIFSVSGLHVGIIVFALNELLVLLKGGRKLRWLSISIVLLLYCAITSFSSSIVRASIMSFILLMANATENRYDPLSALGVAAVVILSINPFDLYDLSFQLSFMACVGILSFADLFRFERKSVNWLLNTICAALAAQFACLPIIVNSFGSVSVISPIANLIVVPIASVLLILSIPLSIITLIFPEFSGIFVILYPFTQVVLDLTEWLSRIDFALITVGAMGLLTIVCYYALFLSCIKFYAVRCLTRIITIAVIVVLSITLILTYNSYNAETAKIAFLSVGNGDCTVITIGEECYVVDSGPGDYYMSGMSNRGYRALSDYLFGEGITEINFILTHDDADHSGGIIRMMLNSEITINKFIYNPKTCIDNDVLEVVISQAKSVEQYQSGNILTDASGADFRFVYPHDDSSIRTNISLAFVFEYKGCSVLFCGDNETKDGKIIANENIDCDIMLLPHHGKESAYCDELIDAASPETIIVSSASSYEGANVYSTATSGQINIFIDKNGNYAVREIKNDKK